MAIPDEETIEQFKARTTRFFSLVGHCITQWAHVDQALFDLCKIALRTTDEITAVVFFRSPNIGDHLVLVDKILQEKLKKQKRQLSVWGGIKKQIDDLLPFRNQLAHNPPIQHGGSLKIYLKKLKDAKGYRANRVEKIGEPYWSITVDERKLLLRPKDKFGQPSKRSHDEIKESDLLKHYGKVDVVNHELSIFVQLLDPRRKRHQASGSLGALPRQRDLRFQE